MPKAVPKIPACPLNSVRPCACSSANCQQFRNARVCGHRVTSAPTSTATARWSLLMGQAMSLLRRDPRAVSRRHTQTQNTHVFFLLTIFPSLVRRKRPASLPESAQVRNRNSGRLRPLLHGRERTERTKNTNTHENK